MKTLKTGIVTMLILATMAGPLLAGAGDEKKPKVKPYTLDTCAVCEMKFGEMKTKPYAFEYKDREIKVCDKDEEAMFKKEPAKYLKKVEEAEAKKAKK